MMGIEKAAKLGYTPVVLAIAQVCFMQVSILAEPFVVTSEDPLFEPPQIVIQYDPDIGIGFDWEECDREHPNSRSNKAKLRNTVLFLQDGIEQMTGVTLVVDSSADLSQGIVLTLLKESPQEIRRDPAIQEALASDGTNLYNHQEAFFIRSEDKRLVIVANTVDGLAAAAPALLESVGYEVLGMGPNWIHVPAGRDHLIFDLQLAGRPSFYIRYLAPMSGQANAGYGTLYPTANLRLHPSDEPVATSYNRWAVGARIMGQSMPSFPGHALQAYHATVAQRMEETGTTTGFLVPASHVGLDSQRPAAAAENQGHLWINADHEGQLGFDKVYQSDGSSWNERPKSSIAHLDLTVPHVREILLDDLKRRAETHFARHPDDVFVFACEPEDGGVDDSTRLKWQHDGNWYPNYRKALSLSGRPYLLHGFKGLKQTREAWDPASRSDMVFGCANWLLREFDQWIDSLPEAERVTATGRSKKHLVRCSIYSYNQHDVPPNFNPDERIRLMIAGFPKHRGRGKWKRLSTDKDIAAAFQRMLPREPSGSYRILSFAYFHDLSAAGIPAGWNTASEAILGDLQSTYQAGIRAMTYETDFNFGKFGLGYYLLAKTLWNVEMTTDELDALRDRWLRRSFGDGWREMKQYYDFLLPGNYPVNGPNSWARAIRLIDAADRKIDPNKEADAQRRINDVKQYWYFHYLLQSGKANRASPELREFIWRGQQSYMVAMNAVVRKFFSEPLGSVMALDQALPDAERQGTARYTHEETQAWWKDVLEFWPLKAVIHFSDTTLADGTKANDVDLNDLVRIKTFLHHDQGEPFFYNSSYMKPALFLTTAQRGDEIGFKLFWPSRAGRAYEAKEVSYGIERWNANSRQWEMLADPTTAVQPSLEVENNYLQTPIHSVGVRFRTRERGVFRINVGRGGDLARLASLGFDLETGKFSATPAHTYFTAAEGLTQSGVYLYLPKGTRSLDLEMSDANPLTLTFHRGLPSDQLGISRQVRLEKRDTHTIELQPGEDGSLALLEGNNFRFPFIYSVPSLWSKSPAELVVPRSIALADGLPIRD